MNVMKDLGKDTIYNCCCNTGIMAHGPLQQQSQPSTLDTDVEPIEQETSCLFSAVVSEYQWIAIDDLLSLQEDMDFTSVWTDEDSADAIALAALGNTDGEQCHVDGIAEDPGPIAEHQLAVSILEQLAAIARVKKIDESRAIDKGRLLPHLRVL